MKQGLIFCLIALIINEVSSEIETKISKYFLSGVHDQFSTRWQKYKGAYEYSIGLTMRETFGKKSVNVFNQNYDDRLILADGLYVNDNVVGVLLQNLTLRELPFLRQPDVTFNLPGHELKIDSAVSRMIVEAEYTLFRNKSSIIYTDDLDPQKQSPFTSSSVQPNGLVTIIAQDCTLNGKTIATLSGVMVHLLHNNFKIHNCRFYVEIYRPDSNAPPVMAPYFSLKQGSMIERILTPKIIAELMKSLQGVVLATVNTTAVFGKDLMAKMRVAHKEVFRETLVYLRKVVSSMNRHTRTANEGSIPIPPLRISWDDLGNQQKMTTISLNEMTLYGLDSAYSSAQGGPLKDPIMRIFDKIRLGTLQVQGKIIFNDVTDVGKSEEYEFTAEIKDLEMDIRLSVDVWEDQENNGEVQTTKGINTFEVLEWRKVVFSILNPGSIRQFAHTLAIAYLYEQVPRTLVKHFYTIFEKAVSEAEEIQNDLNVDQEVSATVEESKYQKSSEEGNYLENREKKLLVINPDNAPLNEITPKKSRPVPMRFKIKNNGIILRAMKDAIHEPLKKELAERLKGNPAKNTILEAAYKVMQRNNTKTK